MGDADDRRMTTDRFYGGVTNRLVNLRGLLGFVERESPSRDAVVEWILEHTRAGSPDAIQHHLAFLDAVELLDLDEESVTLGAFGQQYLDDDAERTLYEALRQNVKGFDTLLRELAAGEMTDEDMMDVLVAEFEEAEMTKPGPAIRHREWLQVLGYLERTDGVNRLSEAGRELLAEIDRESGEPTEQSLETLREEAFADAEADPAAIASTREVTSYDRSEAVREYVLARADGACEGCGEPAPFETPDGEPYLQAHHVEELHGGGPDGPSNVVALCPNCHYRVHHGRDGDVYNEELREYLEDVESGSELSE